MCPPELVRWWNCKHLKTVHRGEPKEGRLFAEKVWRCDVHGVVYEKCFEVERERECGNHVRFGLWEGPPHVRSLA